MFNFKSDFTNSGLIAQQADCIHIDPYANAFNREETVSPFFQDQTFKLDFLGTQSSAMNLKLHERKFEIDSLA
jgi:meiotically up-regulated gene 157 (Mug157) protein